MRKLVRIGTRESQLAVFQATLVSNLLARQGIESELVYLKSDGDIDLITPLYEIGVQGIFTKNLDAALLNHKIDLAVHSMKDIPTQPAAGIIITAVLKRDNPRDLLVFRNSSQHDQYLQQNPWVGGNGNPPVIATSSIRRRAQWLHKYPSHRIENLRGNVNTRLAKLESSNWSAAIFAAAGLERIGLRPDNAVELDWMLPAPAQGAIAIACREEDRELAEDCKSLHDEDTFQCVSIEREFLRTLLGGCSTPIAALAEIEADELFFRGNLFSADGKQKLEVEKILPVDKIIHLGKTAAEEILMQGGEEIVGQLQHAKK